MKCCIYCRIAGEATDSNQLAMEIQAASLRDAAQKLGLEVVDERHYYENGNDPNRESISRLIVDAVAGKIDCVLVKSPGKLARDAICLEEIAKAFQKSGLTVYTPEGKAQIAPLYFLAYARVASLSQVIGEQEMTDAIQALEGKGFSTQEATTLLSQWYNVMSASGEHKPLNWFLENVLPKEASEISGMQLS